MVDRSASPTMKSSRREACGNGLRRQSEWARRPVVRGWMGCRAMFREKQDPVLCRRWCLAGRCPNGIIRSSRPFNSFGKAQGRHECRQNQRFLDNRIGIYESFGSR